MTEGEFRERLLQVLDKKDHIAWSRWTGPGIRKDQLRLHYQQEWLVFVRDFPRFLGRIHGACPMPSVRRALAANIYEEETGGLSFKRPHPEMFLELMEALGFTRPDFEGARLLPEAAAYRAYMDQSMSSDWITGAAVVTLWIEGSVHERRALAGELEGPFDDKAQSHFLVRHHGVHVDQLDLMRAHALVEGGHRDDAWEIVLQNARSDSQREAVLEVMQTSCALWHLYRDAITREAGV